MRIICIERVTVDEGFHKISVPGTQFLIIGPTDEQSIENRYGKRRGRRNTAKRYGEKRKEK
jgi:hypothetical protein